MITERDRKMTIITQWALEGNFCSPESALWLLDEIKRLEKALEVQKLAMQALETRDRSALGVINDKQAIINRLGCELAAALKANTLVVPHGPIHPL